MHRDLKPSNIMVTRTVGIDGTVRSTPVVMDFGLACANTGRPERGAAVSGINLRSLDPELDRAD